MGNCNYAELDITDGTTYISLIQQGHGFHAVEWQPLASAFKDDGVYQSSPFSPGRRLTSYQWSTAIETIKCVQDAANVDDLFDAESALRRMLVSAADYWAGTEAAATPVYIRARAHGETNRRYALLLVGHILKDNNPNAQPVQLLVGALQVELEVVVERLHWQHMPPGPGELAKIAAYLGTTAPPVGLGQEPSVDGAYVANHYTPGAQLTHIFAYDDSGSSLSANLLASTPPYGLLPAVPATDDIIYFGVESANMAQRFSSVVFDIQGVPTGLQLTWEYWNGGGWLNLATNVEWDIYWADVGVCSVHWRVPDFWPWDTTTINGVTGYWVRARVTSGSASTLVQQHRHPYTVCWPYIDVAAGEVSGDVPALAELRLATGSYPTETPPDMGFNRVLVGRRTLARGALFSAIMPICSSAYQPVVEAWTHSPHASITGGEINSICAANGRMYEYVASTDVAFGRLGYFEWAYAPYGQQWFGTYRAFLRVEVPAGTAAGDVKLAIRGSWGERTFGTVTPFQAVPAAAADNLVQTIDLGRFSIPGVSGITMQVDHYRLAVAAAMKSGAIVRLAELILLPIDEWWGDFTDTVLTDDSACYYEMCLDNIRNPREGLRAYENRGGPGADIAYNRFVAIAPGEMILAPDKAQRFWFIFDRVNANGVWSSEHEIAARVTLYKLQRYLGSRGRR